MKINLKKILDSKNISIYSLSKQIGVSQNNLSRIVKGETTSIRYDILEQLCLFLDITPNDIFEIEKSTTYLPDEELMKLKFDSAYYRKMTIMASQLNPDILNMPYNEQFKFVCNHIIDNRSRY